MNNIISPHQFLIDRGFKEIADLTGVAKQVFLVLSPESSQKLQENLSLKMVPKICVFDRCRLGATSEFGGKDIFPLREHDCHYRLYSLDDGKMRAIPLPKLSQNTSNIYQRCATMENYVVKSGIFEGQYFGPMQR